jgi:hypothetical protein
MYEDKIVSPDDAGVLALAISMKSDLVRESHPDDNFFGLGALPQAAYLLRELIDREIATARDKLAKSVIKNIKGLPFAYEFRKKIRKYKKEEGSEEFVKVVSEECEQEIARILAEKLLIAAESQALEDSHPLWARSFYIEWRWGDLESLRQYANRRLGDHPEDIDKFLNALTGTSNDVKENFDQVNIPDPDAEYQFLADILDPEDWMKFIRISNPDTTINSYPETSIDHLPPAVRWFVHTYRQKQKTTASNQ